MKTALWEIFVFTVIVGTAFGSKDAGLNVMLVFYVYPSYLLLRLLLWFIMLLVRDYRKLKAGQGSVTSKTSVKIGIPILAMMLLWAGYDLILNIGPTATVIDAETGVPIEGAIALAQWYSISAVIPEGRFENFDKAKEAFSGKDGKVNIFGFWGLFSDARLTVYKPGYVLWDSRYITPNTEPRTDFDEKHRTVKLLKFATEAARWIKENYEEGKIGPRSMHCSFYNFCDPHSQKFQDIFRANELPLKNKEEDEHSQKLKKEFDAQKKLK